MNYMVSVERFKGKSRCRVPRAWFREHEDAWYYVRALVGAGCTVRIWSDLDKELVPMRTVTVVEYSPSNHEGVKVKVSVKEAKKFKDSIPTW